MAIILDEFGGTSGMVTLEDLLEVVFGDLQDEFDSEIPLISLTKDERIVVRGDISLEQLNDLLDLGLPEDEVKTIGGLLLASSGLIPKIKQIINIDDLDFKIESIKDRGIQTVSFHANQEQIKKIKEIINA